jgi:hypothetical protein
MSMKLISALLPVALAFSCGSVSTETQRNAISPTNATVTPAPQPTKFVVPPDLLESTPDALCNRLSEIKLLPGKDPFESDPIYEALMAKGDAAVPCLVEKVADKTPMRDPRQAPKWQHYAVGDTAVFILVDITREDDREREKLLIEMLPPPFREEWETNGVYAYFNYVSEPRNRKKLQGWWKKWLEENRR